MVWLPRLTTTSHARWRCFSTASSSLTRLDLVARPPADDHVARPGSRCRAALELGPHRQDHHAVLLLEAQLVGDRRAGYWRRARRRRGARPRGCAHRPCRPAGPRAAPPPRSGACPCARHRGAARLPMPRVVSRYWMARASVDLVAVDADDDVARLQPGLVRPGSCRRAASPARRRRAASPSASAISRVTRVELGAEPGPLQLAARRRRCRRSA